MLAHKKAVTLDGNRLQKHESVLEIVAQPYFVIVAEFRSLQLLNSFLFPQELVEHLPLIRDQVGDVHHGLFGFSYVYRFHRLLLKQSVLLDRRVSQFNRWQVGYWLDLPLLPLEVVDFLVLQNYDGIT